MQENFTHSDREKRLVALSSVLSEAAIEGMVATESVDSLAGFLDSHGVVATVSMPAASPVENGLSTLLAAAPGAAVEESEAPRFVRGFHDILISIGLVVGLGGLWGLGGDGGPGAALLLMGAILLMAEILVRRQRLALPAFILTGFFSFAVVSGVSSLLYDSHDPGNISWKIIGTLAVLTVLIGIFYWRYRVPVAFAAFVANAFGTAVLAAFAMISPPDIDGNLTLNLPWQLPMLLGSYAILVFATALWQDMKDRERKTRRSDVAFWLYLVAAPMLVYAVNSVIFYGQENFQWYDANTTAAQAIASVASIAGLMLIGILLDRRAFVTSGLLSLGYVIRILVTSGTFSGTVSNDRIVFVVMVLIGIVVLGLGIGWQALRRLLVNALPQAIQRRLPAIRT